MPNFNSLRSTFIHERFLVQYHLPMQYIALARISYKWVLHRNVMSSLNFLAILLLSSDQEQCNTFFVQNEMTCHTTRDYPSRGTSSIIRIQRNTPHRSFKIHHLRLLHLQSLYNNFPYPLIPQPLRNTINRRGSKIFTRFIQR